MLTDLLFSEMFQRLYQFELPTFIQAGSSFGIQFIEKVGTRGISGTLITGSSVILFFLLLGALSLRYFSFRDNLIKGQDRMKAEPDQLENLFLKVDYKNSQPDLEGAARKGYLRSLTLDRATLVAADENLRKGAPLSIDLGALPGNSSGSDYVNGKVIRMKSLGGVPENWLINVRFTDRHGLSNQLVKRYLKHALEQKDHSKVRIS